MEKPSSLTRLALLRRRVHQSWKTTMLVAVVGGSTFLAAGLMPGVGVVFVLLLLLLLRPGMEVYFSREAVCPHCEADLFLEMCQVENAGGIELGLRCPRCGRDASKVDERHGEIIDIEEWRK
ncbi:hypothetical protein [Rubritalea tangerina]|uniref:Uncharacterized protein n=1 Tax=Rubritalea tangerina TaxID=430798 RepID=A0ABW4ZD25_9BACT